MSPRFHLFVSDFNQGNEVADEFKIPCMAAGMERLTLDLPQAVKNIVGCESVWNL